MVKLWIICAIVKLVAAEMSLSNFPCYKPKLTNYRNGLRIVGGYDAVQSETPYMVGLMKHGGIVCGASIISDKVLILAAHCVCNNQNNIIKPTLLKAYVGMNKLSDVKLMGEKENQIGDDGITEVFIKKIFVHPDYVCGKKTENDIGKHCLAFIVTTSKCFDFPALLHLESPIKFSQKIQPLCLSTDQQASSDTTGRVTGWGWTSENFSLGEKPNVKQSADVPIWDNEDCQSSYSSLMKSNVISKNQMCAGGRNGGLDCEKRLFF